MADAPASGAGARKGVEVQLLSRALSNPVWQGETPSQAGVSHLYEGEAFMETLPDVPPESIPLRTRAEREARLSARQMQILGSGSHFFASGVRSVALCHPSQPNPCRSMQAGPSVDGPHMA